MPTTLTPETIQAITRDYLKRELAKWENRRNKHDGPMPLDSHPSNWAMLIKEFEKDRTKPERVVARQKVKQEAKKLLDERGIEADKDSDEFRALTRELLATKVDWAKEEQRRSQGDYSGGGSVRVAAALGMGTTHQAGSGVSSSDDGDNGVPLTQVIDEYTAEQLAANKWNPKTKDENHACYNLFLEYADEGITTDKIDFKLCREFKAALLKLPANRSRGKEYQGKSIQELIKAEYPKTMTPSTVNKYLNRLSTLLAFAVKNGYMTVNPAAGMQLPQEKRDDELRGVFTHDELTRLFCSEEYLEDKHKKSFHYWVPIIALFTGMRQAEIAQLHLEDIRQEQGVWVLDINDKGDKRLKNANARRLVPLHPFLVDDLKLPEYARQLEKDGKVRLFEGEVEQHSTNGWGQTVTRWFNGNSSKHKGYRQKCGICTQEGGPRKDFHSFRHTLINHLKQKRVDAHLLHEFDGHSHGSMTMDRYGKRYEPQAMLTEVVSVIDFHTTVGLRHLIGSQWAGKE